MAGDTRHNTRKRRRGNALSLIILIIAAAVLIIALWRLIPQLMDYRQSEATYQELQGEVVDLGTDEASDLPDLAPSDFYDWGAVTIDFDTLRQINPDVVGWIRFDDTEAVEVDYPIMHGSNNDTYLRNDLYGERHTGGSIFLEAANSADFSDIYNIVYGHNMRNGTMFGTLRKYRDNEGFYEANRYFTIYTPQGAYRYEIFGYADVRDDSEIYAVGFAPDAAYQRLINVMLSTSIYNTGVVPGIDQRTVTLSTCTASGDDYRFVVYGVCIDQKLY